VLRRGAAATADHIDQPGLREFASSSANIPGSRRNSRIRSAAGIRIGADKRIASRPISAICARISVARARSSTDGDRIGVRTEFQNPAGVCRQQPPRTVGMVPEIITGTSMPRSSQASAIA